MIFRGFFLSIPEQFTDGRFRKALGDKIAKRSLQKWGCGLPTARKSKGDISVKEANSLSQIK